MALAVVTRHARPRTGNSLMPTGRFSGKTALITLRVTPI
jgi:hypothetical protein